MVLNSGSVDYSRDISGFRCIDVSVILFCGVTLMIVCGGIYYNFGTLYLLILEENDIDAPTLALIGTSADCIFCFILPYVASWLRRRGITIGMFLGGFCVSCGVLVSSFVHKIIFWFLTYSILIGVGEGILYMTVVEMVYSKGPPSLRSFVMGFTSGGMFIGLSIFAPLVLWFERITNLWFSLRILAAIFAASTISVIILWKSYQPYLPQVYLRESTISSDWDEPRVRSDSIFFWLKDPSFQLMFVSTLLIALGYIVPFIHILKAAEIDGVTNFDSIPISMGITGFIGRIVCGGLADYLTKTYTKTAPNLNIFTICVIGCGALQCMIPLCNSLWSYSVIAGVYGFFGGGRAGLVTLMCGEVFGETYATVVYGFLCWAFIPQLLGPSAVAYMQEQTGDYTMGFIVVGLLTLSASIPMIYLCFVTQQKINRNADDHYVKLPA